MYSSLGTRSAATILSYTTSTGRNVGPLRLHTLTEFDGQQWSAAEPQTPGRFFRNDLLFPEPAAPGADPTTVAVTVGAMAEDRLALPVEPRIVSVAGRWRYDETQDSVLGDTVTKEGDTYSFEVFPRPLAPDLLRAAPASTGAVDDRFLAVPDTEFAAEITDLARQITASATTDFDRAVAIQNYLRSAANFTYSTQAPQRRTGDAVWDFLQERTGFCVQFATTMVVMARTLGIPTRLAEGYLPGTPANGGWQVTGEDSHAWPELYFAGVGWVRFEPTPAVQTGAAPSYTLDTSAEPVDPVPDELPEDLPDTDQVPLPDTQDAVADNGVTAGVQPMWWIVGVAVVLLGGVTAVVLARRRTSSRPARSAEEAWRRVERALTAAHITVSPSATPRSTPGEIAEAWHAHTGRSLPTGVRDRIDALTREVEAERYSPRIDNTPQRAARLTNLAQDITKGVRSAVRT
jgi:transglutaminase-like putative cysteine protease